MVIVLFLLVFFGSIAAAATQAQTIADPDFESGGEGWTTCSVEVLPLSVLGGGDLDHVAVLDGAMPNGHALCQRIEGFTVGEEYRLGFDAARWMPGPTPAMVSATVFLNGQVLTVCTRIGGIDMQHEELHFTAMAPTIELRIEPGLVGSGAMLVDDLTLRAVNMLPIQLDSYDAWPASSTVEVEWVTATENGNAYFEVERSTDLLTWMPIATVPAMGQSQTPLQYHVSDAAPAKGANYYHLKQVGQDGNVDVSHAIAVNFEGVQREAVLWPNPATDQVRLAGGEEASNGYRVLDAMGRSAAVLQFREGDITLFDVSSLAPGQYLVQDAAGGAPIGRFVKR